MPNPALALDLAQHLKERHREEVARHAAELANARRIRIASIALCVALGAIGGGVAGLFLAEHVLPTPASVVEVCDGR